MPTETDTYKNYDAEELLVILSMADEEPEEAKGAFFEMVLRFREELVRYCVTMCNTEATTYKVIFDAGDAPEIVINAFHQIKKFPENFDRTKANTDNIEKAVEAYMKGIVRTEFKKKYFGVKKIEMDFNYEVDTSEDGELMPSRKVLQGMSQEVKEALMGLSMKEREIFLAYAEFCPNDEYLPRQISQLLQEKLNLAQSTLRVYRKRARQKMQDRFNKLNG